MNRVSLLFPHPHNKDYCIWLLVPGRDVITDVFLFSRQLSANQDVKIVAAVSLLVGVRVPLDIGEGNVTKVRSWSGFVFFTCSSSSFSSSGSFFLYIVLLFILKQSTMCSVLISIYVWIPPPPPPIGIRDHFRLGAQHFLPEALIFARKVEYVWAIHFCRTWGGGVY